MPMRGANGNGPRVVDNSQSTRNRRQNARLLLISLRSLTLVAVAINTPLGRGFRAPEAKPIGIIDKSEHRTVACRQRNSPLFSKGYLITISAVTQASNLEQRREACWGGRVKWWRG